MNVTLPDAIKQTSPNFNARRNGVRPDMIVLHYTAMESAEAALQRLCDPESEVSAHYLIANDGRVWQLVDDTERAWHAGQGSWGGLGDINSRSIGIELDNTGMHPFAEPLMQALEELLPQLMSRWNIPPERVIAHSDMAPERKSDPGPRFDWRRLALRDLSIWPDAPLATDATFDELANTFGFPAETDPKSRLRAFRDRFRPHAKGALNQADIELLAAIADRWPAKRES